jgi:AraC-like DNA-binding protein
MVLEPEAFRRLCRARAILCDVDGDAPTVGELAARLGLSPFQLIRSFEAAFGRTPHQLRIHARLERAKHLLAADRPVTDVCMGVGFSSLGSTAIQTEGRLARIEGLWWQFSLTERSEWEPAAVRLLRIARGRDGVLEVSGRSWGADGRLCATYLSEAVREKKEPSAVFYYWKGERPLDANAPKLEGTGEIRLESGERAAGYWTTHADTGPGVNARTVGVYLRADPEDLTILDGRDISNERS